MIARCSKYDFWIPDKILSWNRKILEKKIFFQIKKNLEENIFSNRKKISKKIFFQIWENFEIFFWKSTKIKIFTCNVKFFDLGWLKKYTRLTRGAGPSLAWKPQNAGDQKRILERWDNWIMRVSQKRVLVASWPFMQNCCYCYIFDPRFRPDNVKGFFRPIFLSHDKRLLVKEKNARTSRDRPIARFLDPRAVVSAWRTGT